MQGIISHLNNAKKDNIPSWKKFAVSRNAEKQILITVI